MKVVKDARRLPDSQGVAADAAKAKAANHPCWPLLHSPPFWWLSRPHRLRVFKPPSPVTCTLNGPHHAFLLAKCGGQLELLRKSEVRSQNLALVPASFQTRHFLREYLGRELQYVLCFLKSSRPSEAYCKEGEEIGCWRTYATQT